LFSSGRKFFEHLSFLHNITIIAPIYLVRENSLNTWRAWRQQGLKLNTPSMDLVGKQQPAQTIVGVHGERGEMKAGRSVLTLMGRLEGGVNGLELMRGEARKQCCSRGLEPRWRVIGDEPPPRRWGVLQLPAAAQAAVRARQVQHHLLRPSCSMRLLPSALVPLFRRMTIPSPHRRSPLSHAPHHRMQEKRGEMN
jgi:hypothetical protein